MKTETAAPLQPTTAFRSLLASLCVIAGGALFVFAVMTHRSLLVYAILAAVFQAAAVGFWLKKQVAWVALHLLAAAGVIDSWLFIYKTSVPAAVGITIGAVVMIALCHIPAVKLDMGVKQANRVLIGIVLSTFFLLLAFRDAPFDRIWQAMLTMQFAWLIPAIAIYILAIWIRALRWRYIMNPVKHCTVKSLFPIYVISYMANNVLPLRMGDIYRAYIVGKKEKVSKTAALTTVAVERIFDGLTMLLFLIIISFMFPFSEDIKTVIRIGSYGFIGILALCYVFLWKKETTKKLFYLIVKRAPERPRAVMIKIFDSFFVGLEILKGPKDLALVTVLSVITWVLEAVMYDLTLRGFNVQMPFYASLSALAVVNLGIILPAGPGYFGPFEYFCSLVLGTRGFGANPAYGITEEISKAYALMLHVVGQWIPSTLLGLYYMWREHISFHEVQEQAGQNVEKPVS